MTNSIEGRCVKDLLNLKSDLVIENNTVESALDYASSHTNLSIESLSPQFGIFV